LGKVIHKVLELFHESEYSSFDDLLMLLDKNWLVGGYKYDQQQEQYRLDAINMLNNYWKYIQKNPVNKIITEHWFSFESEHAYLSGKCDRIDIDAQDKISIIDYKTSQTTKTENEIKKDIQLGIYALFLFINGIELGEDKIIKDIPKKLSMLFLRENNPEVSVQFHFEDLNQFKNNIKSTAEGIKRREFEGIKGKHCDWCDYRDLICPLFG
jgi:RecB family exonuclease